MLKIGPAFFQEHAKSIPGCQGTEQEGRVTYERRPQRSLTRDEEPRKEYVLWSQKDLDLDSGPDTPLEDTGQVTSAPSALSTWEKYD